MSSSSWQDQFQQTLARLTKSERLPRIAIVGIGHELCGDDAAGVALARAMQEQYNGNGRDDVLVIEAGSAPENCSGLLRRFRPDLVLLVDAAYLDARPGTVRWLDWQDTVGFSASTHTLPLHLLATYLTSELGCEVALLGIQPADVTAGAPLSSAVKMAVDSVTDSMLKMLSAAETG